MRPYVNIILALLCSNYLRKLSARLLSGIKLSTPFPTASTPDSVGASSEAERDTLQLIVMCFIATTCTHVFTNTHRGIMRTNIEIDDILMADALKATGLSTKKEAVELGLKVLIKLNKQASIRALRGKLKWEGNLDEMRAK